MIKGKGKKAGFPSDEKSVSKEMKREGRKTGRKGGYDGARPARYDGGDNDYRDGDGDGDNGSRVRNVSQHHANRIRHVWPCGRRAAVVVDRMEG